MGLGRRSGVEGPAARRAALLAELRRVVFEAPARSNPAVRTAAARGSGLLAEPIGAYAGKVRDESFRVTDTDVAELRAAGVSEDEIFEVTVAAALGAACHRFDAGLRALREET